MKVKLHIIRLVLGMILLMPSICFARDYRDSIILNRIWTYSDTFEHPVNDFDSNGYTIFTMTIHRRNFLLWMVPTMYSIARGDREFIGESYGKMKFHNRYSQGIWRQVLCGTIPRNRQPIPALFEMPTPNLQGELFYDNRLLSPFHRNNKRYYRYRINYSPDSIGNTVQVTFTPRVLNTQLVSGDAWVNFYTGAIDSISFKANFDMVRYRVSAVALQHNQYRLPKVTNMSASFNFLGNNISADFTTLLECERTLPDSINNFESRAEMERIRPLPLTAYQDSIYHARDTEKLRQQMEEDSLPKKKKRKLDRMRDFMWDVVGDHMANSTDISSESGKASISFSPLFNPFYMSYSSKKGLSYKLSVYAMYRWNAHHFLTLEPDFGYVTKLKQFYYTIPLTMHYNPKRDGRAGIIWGNGNRTSNGALQETFNKAVGDSISFPEFRDEYVAVFNNIGLFNWLKFTTGLYYHIRKATTQHAWLQRAHLPVTYRSFAPFLTVHLQPWRQGPMLTGNFERSIMNVLGANLQYTRWEFDASYKKTVNGMRVLNLRGGTGFYTNRSSDFFVDFSNFRDNNLPTGWEDDWSGQFQLVDSRWYNESNYYVRGHISYDSPLLLLSWMPWVGRFMESERLYFSALGIEHTRPYFELGYGFKTRYFSTGVFTSFLNTRYQGFEFKFTFELFRRW